jgi:hypothetical protein
MEPPEVKDAKVREEEMEEGVLITTFHWGVVS